MLLSESKHICCYFKILFNSFFKLKLKIWSLFPLNAEKANPFRAITVWCFIAYEIYLIIKSVAIAFYLQLYTSKISFLNLGHFYLYFYLKHFVRFIAINANRTLGHFMRFQRRRNHISREGGCTWQLFYRCR
jgi:hypothetical protein